MRNVEKNLNEFFLNESKIEVIKNSIIKLNNKKEYLENQIKDLKIDFNISIKASSVSDMPIGSINPASYFEKDILKQIERSESVLNNINVEILQLQNELLLLQLKNEKLDRAINMLNTNIKQLLVFKYKEKLSEIDIAYRLSISISNYHRKKKQALETISNILTFYENIS